MTVSKFIHSKSRITCFLAMLIFVISSQKLIDMKAEELRVVVIGDIGFTESQSSIKKIVVERIRRQHEKEPFQLGIILGDNVYDFGSKTDDFETLSQIFGSSFPLNIYHFDFLAVLGNHDYLGDPDTQIQYHLQHEPRFYMPEKNYHYDVKLANGTKIRFVCVDSTPLYELFLVNYVKRLNQINILLKLLDDSGGFDYVFLILHHNVLRGCGPHRRVPGDAQFTKLITHKYLSAILNGHNHNMQMSGRRLMHPPVFTVGNSARVDSVGISETDDIWCQSPATGGFGQLTISNKLANFRFFSGDGQLLAQAKLDKAQRT
ncbi:hypothetical protein RF11_10661 [Thelohanellus kitauei]|uniref:Calcineurin-like phosphoesterase domain-containing protein n=1 Tax=Thelohanellus kitauei TaxID=669202 RepID=A0A0C2N5X6_THEKT|nr:hypothetical protein RF11_10661 [Thelohanellus kitauei]